MNTPTVSVIVPNYNHARFLVQRIDSILAQTFTDFELILIDDCSTDDSRNVMEQYRTHPKVSHIIFNEKNSGSPFAQWLKGISLAKGKYIWIAESDDFVDKEFLAVAMRELEAGADLFYCRSERVDENGNISGNMNDWYNDLSPTRWTKNFKADAYEELISHVLKKNTIVNASAVVFRNGPDLDMEEWLEESTRMRYCGDWLFWMHYLDESESISFSADVTNYFRFHANVSRKTHKPSDRNAEVLRVLEYAIEIASSPETEKELVRYYFKEHLYVAPRSAIGTNFVQFFKQVAVSSRFIGVWWKYYFTGKR